MEAFYISSIYPRPAYLSPKIYPCPGVFYPRRSGKYFLPPARHRSGDVRASAICQSPPDCRAGSTRRGSRRQSSTAAPLAAEGGSTPFGLSASGGGRRATHPASVPRSARYARRSSWDAVAARSPPMRAAGHPAFAVSPPPPPPNTPHPLHPFRVRISRQGEGEEETPRRASFGSLESPARKPDEQPPRLIPCAFAPRGGALVADLGNTHGGPCSRLPSSAAVDEALSAWRASPLCAARGPPARPGSGRPLAPQGARVQPSRARLDPDAHPDSQAAPSGPVLCLRHSPCQRAADPPASPRPLSPTIFECMADSCACALRRTLLNQIQRRAATSPQDAPHPQPTPRHGPPANRPPQASRRRFFDGFGKWGVECRP